jgi:drug/metabolite transporter (DMT)-like permease
MPNARKARLAELSLVAMASVWGLTFVMVQDAIERLPALTFLGYRFVPAAAIVALACRRQLGALSKDGWRAGLVMGVLLTGLYVFQTLGLERTSASNAGFITGLFVVLTPVFGALLFGQRPPRLVWACALVAAVGLFLLSGGAGQIALVGDSLVFVGACFFALHIHATDRAVAHHDVGALVAVQLGVVGVACLAYAALAGDLEVPSSAVEWNALVVTSLVASALGFFVQTYAQQHAPPARVAIVLASEPVFAGFFAYVLKGETLAPLQWLGALAILGAIFTVELLPYLRREGLERHVVELIPGDVVPPPRPPESRAP